MKSRKLTPKQASFVKAYLTNGFNATQAAKSAGYSEKTANEQGARLLANVSIQKELSKHQKKAAEKFEIKKEDILKGLLKIAERSMEKVEVNQETGEERVFPYDPQMYVKAINELNKMLGFYEPEKHEHNLGLTHENLMKLIHG